MVNVLKALGPEILLVSGSLMDAPATTITKALKETGGASAEYQDAVIELNSLKHVLQHLEALQPTEENIGHVNAIRGMALACQLPLRDFLKKLEAYESSLGPWRERKSFSSAGRKTRWAVSFGQEVEKLRARVAVKLISMNLLLASHSLQTVSSMGTRVQRDHRDLMSMITEQRAALHKVHDIAEHVENRLGNLDSTTQARLDATSSKSDATYNSVMSLRNIGEQIGLFIRSFPREIRDLLHAILRADFRTYQAVLQIQESISRAPSSLHGSDIRFTNALGEYRELPYEYFCHWEPFEGFLRAQFKNKPGESKIVDGHFHILDVNRERQIVQKEHWNRAISQGVVLTMSMIMSGLQRKYGCCPQPDCADMGIMEVAASGQLTCGTCYLKVFPTSNGLEDSFSHVLVSEEDIARQQAEEDLRLYGSRPEPPEAIEIHETSPSSNLSLGLNGSESVAVVDRPTKMLKRGESKASNYDTVTAMDWNSGASPLDAWLNQSAIPSTAVALEPLNPGDSNQDLIAQELEEIKVFRNVHMATASERQNVNEAVNELEALEVGAQIYYRNIRDRYPLLPLYLARRLALANFRRYERLCSKRPTTEHSTNQAAAMGPEQTAYSLSTTSRFKRRRLEIELQHIQLILELEDQQSQSENSMKELESQKKELQSIQLFRELESLENASSAIDSLRYVSDLSSNVFQELEKQQLQLKNILQALEFLEKPSLSPVSKLFLNYLQEIKDSLKDIMKGLKNSKHFSLSSFYFARKLVLFTPMGLNEPFQMEKAAESSFSFLSFRNYSKCFVNTLNELTEQRSHLENIMEGLEFLGNYVNDCRSNDLELRGYLLKDIIKKSKPLGNAPFSLPSPRYSTVSSLNNTESTSCNTKGEPEARPRTHSPPLSDFWTGGSPRYSPASSMNSSLHRRPKFDPQEQSPTSQGIRFRHSSADLDTLPNLPSPPVSDFWTGGSRRCSSSSSMNSSLHGRPSFDLHEQNPTFADMHSRHSSADLDAPPTLPPPPVKLGKDLTFDCDICGQTIQVERRRQWQIHVLRDLRPHLCIYEDCATADKTYASRTRFQVHKSIMHKHEFTKGIETRKLGTGPEREVLTDCAGAAKLKSDMPTQENTMSCIFCREVLSATRTKRAEHLGRHMEEIAFSVLTKPYEDWDFYSDSSTKADNAV